MLSNTLFLSITVSNDVPSSLSAVDILAVDQETAQAQACFRDDLWLDQNGAALNDPTTTREAAMDYFALSQCVFI